MQINPRKCVACGNCTYVCPMGAIYIDPAIKFLRSGNRGVGKSTAAGYYIVPHCGPDCCQAFGGLSVVDLGPFATRTKAREWSRTYLAEPAGTAR